jgi:hypothetical protein
MVEKPMMPAKTKAKNEQRLALMVPESPTEMAVVSKFFLAEPISTKMAIACRMYPNLFVRKHFARCT